MTSNTCTRPGVAAAPACGAAALSQGVRAAGRSDGRPAHAGCRARPGARLGRAVRRNPGGDRAAPPDEALWQRGIDMLQARRARCARPCRKRWRRHVRARGCCVQRGLLLHAGVYPFRGEVPTRSASIQLSQLDRLARQALQKGIAPSLGARAFLRNCNLAAHACASPSSASATRPSFFQTLFAGRRQTSYLAVMRDAQDSLGLANDAHIAFELMKTARRRRGRWGNSCSAGWRRNRRRRRPAKAPGLCARSWN